MGGIGVNVEGHQYLLFIVVSSHGYIIENSIMRSMNWEHIKQAIHKEQFIHIKPSNIIQYVEHLWQL